MLFVELPSGAIINTEQILSISTECDPMASAFSEERGRFLTPGAIWLPKEDADALIAYLRERGWVYSDDDDPPDDDPYAADYGAYPPGEEEVQA